MKKEICQQLVFDFCFPAKMQNLVVQNLNADEFLKTSNTVVVVSLTEHRAAKNLKESAPYFSEILNLFRHLK